MATYWKVAIAIFLEKPIYLGLINGFLQSITDKKLAHLREPNLWLNYPCLIASLDDKVLVCLDNEFQRSVSEVNEALGHTRGVKVRSPGVAGGSICSCALSRP